LAANILASCSSQGRSCALSEEEAALEGSVMLDAQSSGAVLWLCAAATKPELTPTGCMHTPVHILAASC